MPAATFDGNQKVDYKRGGTPTTYVCEICNKGEIKLWRETGINVNMVTLRCSMHRTDKHSCRAIPSTDNETFNSPTFWPKYSERWWKRLPLQ